NSNNCAAPGTYSAGPSATTSGRIGDIVIVLDACPANTMRNSRTPPFGRTVREPAPSVMVTPDDVERHAPPCVRYWNCATPDEAGSTVNSNSCACPGTYSAGPVATTSGKI